jgi:DNA polymerase-3 subunit gamma/tau
MSQTLYRKYRPLKFEDLKSQEHILTILKGQVEESSFSHSYLFTGPRGCGKTSAARIFARAINCLDPKKGEPCNKCINCESAIAGTALDIIEIDAASNRSIDDVREFKEKINFQPFSFEKKVFIIDEVHMLTKEAFNALLKTLEEPPDFVVFILATTDVHKVPPTILSRCQRFEFKLATNEVLVSKLKNICEIEGVEIDDEALKLIARQAKGSFRDSESILEKVIHFGGQKVTIKEAEEFLGIPSTDTLSYIARALIAHDFENCRNKFVKDLVETGANVEIFVSELIELLKEEFLDSNIEEVFIILRKLINLNSELRMEDKKALLIEITFYEICNPLNISTQITVSHEELPEVELSTDSKKSNSNSETKKEELAKNDESREVGALNLDELQQVWLELVAEVGRNNMPLSGYLLNARPHSVTGQIINIVVKYKLHKNLLEKQTSFPIIRSAFEEILGEKFANYIIRFNLVSEIGEVVNSPIDQSKILGELLN